MRKFITLLAAALSLFAAPVSAQSIRNLPAPTTGTGNWVLATGPTLVTPVLGAATGTSLALNGCTIGSDNLCVTGGFTTSGAFNLGGGTFARTNNDVQIWNGAYYGWSSTTGATGTGDVKLYRDAANTLALRNGTAAQTFSVYGTYTDASNYEKLSIQKNNGRFEIGAFSSGTGANLSIHFLTGGGGGTTRWSVSANGDFLASTDNTYDIGANGATRPRDLYLGRNFQASGYALAGSTAALGWAGGSGMFNTSDGVIRLSNNAGTDFSRLQFGGTTSSFPALKRNTNYLEVKLADDSGYANIRSRLVQLETGTVLQDTADGALKVGNSGSTSTFTMTAGAANLATFNGPVTAGTLTTSGQIVAASMTQTSAPQSGTVCWAAAGLTYDATLGCLASLPELKDFHGPITGALATLRKITPYWASWKQGTPEWKGGDRATQPVFDAREVEKVDARLTANGPDGELRGVRYMEMTAFLTAALNEQQDQIDSLKAANADLAARLDRLEATAAMKITPTAANDNVETDERGWTRRKGACNWTSPDRTQVTLMACAPMSAFR